MVRRARRDNAIGRKRRSSRAPSDADATPRQTAWFIIIAGEESGVYEGMRWDGWDERAKPQFRWAISSVHPMSPRCPDPIKRMGTDSDIDVGVETCWVVIRGGQGPIQVPSPSFHPQLLPVRRAVNEPKSRRTDT